jgi:hypothetical protein
MVSIPYTGKKMNIIYKISHAFTQFNNFLEIYPKGIPAKHMK